MEENITPEGIQVDEKQNGSGCLGQVGWFLSGAVLPMGSLTYYRKAGQRSVGSAILFFLAFTLVVSTLLTIGFGVGMYSVINDIQDAYANGDIPEISISNGVAEVNGEQPFILFNDTASSGQNTFVAVDTTGRITEIDTSRYQQGFLLTRTELHIVNAQNGYQVLPLYELNTMFEKDPLLINADTVSRLWGVTSSILVVLGFIFIAIWHMVVRLMIISVMALVIWGVVSLMRPNTDFGPIIITGLYAIVPAIYLSRLFSRANFGLPGLQTLFLLGFWMIGLAANFMDTKDRDDRPMRLWTSLIGLPMLILFVWDIFWTLPSPGGLIALWVVTLLTGLVLAGLRFYFRMSDQRSEPPPAEPAQLP